LPVLRPTCLCGDLDQLDRSGVGLFCSRLGWGRVKGAGGGPEAGSEEVGGGGPAGEVVGTGLGAPGVETDDKWRDMNPVGRSEWGRGCTLC